MNVQFKKGVVEICVLLIISKEDSYGFEIVDKVNEHFECSSNTIYPILKRFIDDALCTTYLMESTSGPARKYYKITNKGIEQLTQLIMSYEAFTKSVNTLIKENQNE